MENTFQQIVDAINNPITKTIWLFVAGIIMRKWPEFTNKWIPTILTILSGLAAVLGALAGQFSELPTTVPTSFAAMPQVEGKPIWMHFIFSWLIPVLVAIGTQSGVKNTREAVQQKKPLLTPRAPVTK